MQSLWSVRGAIFGKLILGSLCLCFFLAALAGCNAKGGGSANSTSSANNAPFMSAVASAPPQSADDAPPPASTDGFDGKRAFAYVAKQVSFGPRPSGSQAILQTQDYLQSELKSYGCAVETDSFTADTPIGRLPMKNILVKIPGDKPGVILLGTHYDTLLKENFVGADDGGSSTAVMLELARLLCPQRGKYAVWIAFFDGEEAMKQWSDTDSRYGSRQMAAKLATSGELPKVKAFLLADIVGSHPLRIKRDSYSTKALTDLIWKAAARLGYQDIFVNEETGSQDDHQSFIKRGVPAVDVITDFSANGYWHTPQDTLDKVSARSLAVVGHVFLESVKQLQSK
jgi:Zn-dependent M28 family amino/carboxypeptidase